MGIAIAFDYIHNQLFYLQLFVPACNIVVVVLLQLVANYNTYIPFS